MMVIKSIALALAFSLLAVGQASAKHKHRKVVAVPQCFIICPPVAAKTVVSMRVTMHRAKRHRVRSFKRAVQSPSQARQIMYGGGGVVATARQYIGSGPVFGRRNLWCARFTNYVLEKAGYRGTGSDLAMSFARYGHRTGLQVGSIAVMGRRRGGHVGIVSGIDSRGNPILISGNYRNKVVEHVYPKSRILAYVQP